MTPLLFGGDAKKTKSVIQNNETAKLRKCDATTRIMKVRCKIAKLRSNECVKLRKRENFNSSFFQNDNYMTYYLAK